MPPLTPAEKQRRYRERKAAASASAASAAAPVTAAPVAAIASTLDDNSDSDIFASNSIDSHESHEATSVTATPEAVNAINVALPLTASTAVTPSVTAKATEAVTARVTAKGTKSEQAIARGEKGGEGEVSAKASVAVRERAAPANRPKRKPFAKPCSPSQYALAMTMMQDGSTFAAIRCATGATWGELEEYGLQIEPHDWCAKCERWSKARAQKILDKAQSIAMQEEAAEVNETSGPMGVTRSERRRSDPAMIAQVLGGLLPEIHGKLASKQTTAVQVNISLVDAVAELERLEAASRPTVDISEVEPTTGCGGA